MRETFEDREFPVRVRGERVAPGRMAARAGDGSVPSRQRKSGLAVIEFRGWPPGIHRVAGEAALADNLPAVLVAMAGEARARQSQESPRGIGAARLQGRLSALEGRPVALPAALRRVGAFEGEPGLPVIKSGHSRFSPINELELPPMVLVVAGLALLMAGPGVKPLAGGDPRLERRVAVKATRRGHALARLVALQAVGAPFQPSVRLAQLARRELGRDRKGGQEEEQQRDPTAKDHGSEDQP